MKRERFHEITKSTAASCSGVLAVSFLDLTSGDSFCFNGDTPVPAASTCKVFILLELYRQAALGLVDLHQRIALTEENKTVGTGILNDMEPGLMPTLKDYAGLMVSISDNTAADTLYRHLTAASIQENVLRPLGLTGTKLDLCCRDMISSYYGTPVIPGENSELYFKRVSVADRKNPYFSCTSARNTSTTANDMTKALKAAYLGTLCGGKSDGMMDILQNCQTNARIPALLPAKTSCYHKTGSLDRVSNDAGIVRTPKGDYILSLFYNGNMASDEEYEANRGRTLSDPMLAKLSLDIYTAYMA